MTTKKTDSRDPTIAEIHRTRRQTAEKFGGDIDAIIEDARKRQAASGRRVWQGPTAGKTIPPSSGNDELPGNDAPAPTGRPATP